MTAKHTKYLKLYVSDYLVDTTHLSAVDHGAYLLLLLRMHQSRAPLVDDAESLRAIARVSADEWPEVAARVLPLLVLRQDGWVSKRLFNELEKAERAYKKRLKSITELNNRRKGMPRSSLRSPSRSSQRHSSQSPSRQPSPPSRDNYNYSYSNGEPAPGSDGPGGAADPPARKRDNRPDVVVTLPTGAQIKISCWGGVDEVWSPRDHPPLAFTRKEAMAMYEGQLALDRQPRPTADVVTLHPDNPAIPEGQRLTVVPVRDPWGEEVAEIAVADREEIARVAEDDE